MKIELDIWIPSLGLAFEYQGMPHSLSSANSGQANNIIITLYKYSGAVRT